MAPKDFSWMGVPTKLLRKTTIVEACENPVRLPVYTLTFEIPSEEEWTRQIKGPRTEAESWSEEKKTDQHFDAIRRKMKRMQLHHSKINISLGDVIKMNIPNYKPKSYSVSALRLEKNEFDVTVKIYPKGRASGYLDSLQIGDTIRSFGKSSNKHRNFPRLNEQGSERICIIAYGVGITEALPVARAEIERMSGNLNQRSTKVILLWASRTMGDTFWHEQIEELQKLHGNDRFEVIHLLSREEDPLGGSYKGRINPTIMKRAFDLENAKTNGEFPLFLSVGTKEMMSMTSEMLSSMGYSMPKHKLLLKTSLV